MPKDVPFYLQYPVKWRHRVTDRFNAPRAYTFAPDKLQKHEGIDFAPVGPITGPLYVLAAQRGVVSQVGYNPQGYGTYVRIDHDWNGERWVTWYGHMASALVREGDFVTAGQVIGIAGSTGFSTGTHVHLTLQRIGRGLSNYVVDDVVDPEPYLVSAPVHFDEASWVADVTVIDGAVMKPGQAFVKTWRIRNTGTRAWIDGYRLAYFSDHRMNGPESVLLPRLQPRETVDVSVTLTAPTAPGAHRSTWKPQNEKGEFFDYVQWADIVVAEPERPPEQAYSEAGWVADVTVEDGTVMRPGESFLKVWRIRNQGRTIWGEGYRFAFFSGERMGGPQSVPLPPAAPGEEVEVSVRLTAPASPGVYRSTWKPQNPQGQFFEHAQWAEIRVAGQPLANEASLVADGFSVRPGETFVKTWRMRNIGRTAWRAGTHVVFSSGERMNGPDRVSLSETMPGEEVIIALTLTAPEAPGYHRGTWRLRGEHGEVFGPELHAVVFVLGT